MRYFLVEILFVSLAAVISIIFMFNPSPFMMFAFAFIAQPLFIFAILSTVWLIFRDLRKKKVI